MVLLHTLDAEELTSLRGRLPAGEPVWLTTDPRAFGAAAADCDGVIVVGDGREPPAWLVRWRGRRTDVPLVLVAQRDARPSVRGALLPDRTLTADVVSEVLPVALRQARLLGLLHRWTGEIETDTRFPLLLRDAIIRSLRVEPVPPAVRIARWSGCDPSTVHRWWRNAVGTRGPTLKAFLDGLLLVRALVERAGGITWNQVARRLGVDVRTLRSASRRVLGATPTELEAMRPDDLDAELREAFTPLLAGASGARNHPERH